MKSVGIHGNFVKKIIVLDWFGNHRMNKDILFDPLSIKRTLPTRSVKIEDLKLNDNFERDDIFTKKYDAFINGKSKAYVTRIKTSRIKNGFYRPSSSGLMHICDEIKPDQVDYMVDLIKIGFRPPLYLYHNINKSDEFDFLCADDINTLQAYRTLKIDCVPSIVLDSKAGLEESAYTLRVYELKNNEKVTVIDGFYHINKNAYYSLLGSKKPPLIESLDYLLETTQLTQQKLKLLHKSTFIEFHYHHTVFSILKRAENTLQAMKTLFEKNLYTDAATLVRSLYELVLTYYIDWLGPEKIHKYIELSSLMTEAEWQKECDKSFKKCVREGTSQSVANKIKDAHMRGFKLASTVSEKARLFPVGEEHHKSIYSFLSKIAHHDYSMTARFAHTLEHEDSPQYNSDIADTTIYCVDMFISELVLRVLEDVGEQKLLESKL